MSKLDILTWLRKSSHVGVEHGEAPLEPYHSAANEIEYLLSALYRTEQERDDAYRVINFVAADDAGSELVKAGAILLKQVKDAAAVK